MAKEKVLKFTTILILSYLHAETVLMYIIIPGLSNMMCSYFLPVS